MSQTHPTNVSLSEPLLSEIAAGTAVALKFQVSCSHGCALQTSLVEVICADECVTRGELVRYDGHVNETDEIELAAPQQVGEHQWRLVFSGHESENLVHKESALDLHFKTVPHTCSMAVWDVPSPAAIGEPVQVKVGVCCSVACQLGGGRVEIHDEAGTKIGEGKLGESPRAGTSALYWTVIELEAIATEDVHFRTVVFTDAGTKLPHEKSNASFSFRTDKPKQHLARVTVLEKSTRLPVGNVEVRCGPYMASTDNRGIAKVALPQGTFEISIRKDGFQAKPFSMVVHKDLAVDVEATAVPTQTEIAERIFENYPWG